MRGINPVKYVDPTRRASILQRVINKWAGNRDANKAWKEHYKDITKDRGKVIDFSKLD